MNEEDRRWNSYLWAADSGEPMLANRYQLRDEAVLREREYAETAARTADLRLGRIRIPHTRDLSEWQALHAHLFGNVYDWAGQLRSVGMFKRTVEFLRPQDFDHYVPAVFDQAGRIDWPELDRDQFVADVAWLYMHLNWIHPFREGNGRATRLFVDRYTAPARWRLDFTQVSTVGWNVACQDASPEGYQPPTDPGLLTRAISMATTARTPPGSIRTGIGDPPAHSSIRDRAWMPAADIAAAIHATGVIDPTALGAAPPETTPGPQPPAPETGTGPDL